MENFLLQLFIFLAAAAIAVPIAKKLGLGSVLGYLVAGMAIGPFGVSLIQNVDDVMHFTEFGVVMMLFLVGLELRPSMLWRMRLPILGTGGAQVVLSSIVLSAAALYFLPWQQALAVGLTLSLSSTAIVLQTLNEKGLMETRGGRSIFSVLLFQDLAVIPMLAGFPLLATLAVAGGDDHHGALFDNSNLPNYMRVIIAVLAIGFVIVAGKFAVNPLFRAIAKARVREVFVAAVLALVIGTSVLMLAVGLSPALGAFLAGVMLSDSEFRHQLESDIEPFKGLLLGIFFISIGASLNFTLIAGSLPVIAGLTFGLLFIKWVILLAVSYVFRVNRDDRLLFSIALAQGGEFAFVLFQFARGNGVLPPEVVEPLISAVAITMFLTPLIFILHDLIERRQKPETQTQEADTIIPTNQKVIMAGFGRTGTDVGRFLLTAGIKPVILDHDADNVKLLRKFGFEVYYGDATRLDLLEAAGADRAKLLIITIGHSGTARKLVELVKKHYPNLKIYLNAHDLEMAFEMMDEGVQHIQGETVGSAISLGQMVIEALGVEPYRAHRLAMIFKKKEQDLISALYAQRSEETSLISSFQSHHENLEKLMELDGSAGSDYEDRAWTVKNPET